MNTIKEYQKRFYNLLESKSGDVKPLIYEQQTGTTNDTGDLTSQGYQDITAWFSSAEGVMYLPDGDYKGEGFGYNETIKTTDGKDTGYIVVFSTASRGSRDSNIKISQNGAALALKSIGDFSKLLLNSSKLNSSGLSTKK
jgi:hypothetical protein